MPLSALRPSPGSDPYLLSLNQAAPVFRVFMPRHLAVGPRHTDAAYHAQPNEINVWIPFTDAFESNSLHVESAAGAADFEPIACGYGELYLFRGNECEHYSECNLTGATRVSMDFRVIRQQELAAHPVLEATDTPRGGGGGKQSRGAGEYFTLGRYYRRTAESGHRTL